jgi:steroid delta-isomerase-like uncharacterized protein
MSTEESKAVARRYYHDVLNNRRLDALDQLAVADYAEHDPFPGQQDGRPGLMQRVEMLIDAFAPYFEIEDVIAEGDRVVVRWTHTGTHVGEFLGMAPTGRSFNIAGIDIYRMQDGKLAEHWHVVDQFSLLVQLGVIPAPAGAPA